MFSSSSIKPLDELTITDITNLKISSDLADSLFIRLNEIIREYGAHTRETWMNISVQLLNPDLPFEFHQLLYYGCYKHYGPDPPAWLPHPDSAVLTNVGQILERRGMEFLGSEYKDPISSFPKFQEFSVSNPEVYWKMLLGEMDIWFSVAPSCILHEHSLEEGCNSYPGGQWLPGAFMNSAENCLRLNRKRSASDVLIIWRDEGAEEIPLNYLTRKELQEEVWLVAHALETLGLDKGSAIAINMPMNVTAVIAYLSVVLAGYVVVSIADSFAPLEISSRLKISKAKAIITQDFIVRGNKSIQLYSRVVEAEAPIAIVVYVKGSSSSTKLRNGDTSWIALLGRVNHLKGEVFEAVQQPIEAFTNILFSSGTTGQPKAIPWTHATPLKAAADAWCHMDIREGDTVAWPTNLGWMMGPWLVYASLLNGASMALYDGSPLGSGFIKFVQDAKVTMLGVVPSIVRAWKNSNCTDGYDWSHVRCFSSTGEASNVDEYLWLMGRAGYKPVIEYCGGTEIGGAFATGSLLQAQSISSFSTPAMGCTLYIIGSDGTLIVMSVFYYAPYVFIMLFPAWFVSTWLKSAWTDSTWLGSIGSVLLGLALLLVGCGFGLLVVRQW